MVHRFVIYPFSHTMLLIDITEIGRPNEIFPPEGNIQMVPTIHFQSWQHVETYLLQNGADANALAKAIADGKRGRISVLSIV